MYRKILVPLDGSSLAETALVNAIDLVQGQDTELLLVTVVEPHYSQYSNSFDVDVSMFSIQEAENELTERFRTYLEETLKRLQAQGLRVSGEIRYGSAASEIIDFATEKNVDIIVISTHGRSGLARWYLGSVADRVTHAATMPVLLVRAKTKK